MHGTQGTHVRFARSLSLLAAGTALLAPALCVPASSAHARYAGRGASILRAYPLALSPDGRVLALAGSEEVHLFDTRTGASLGSVPPPGGFELVSPSFSPDSRLLVIAETRVALWDVATRKHVARVEGWGPAAFWPDDRTLATGTLAGEVAFWDAPGFGAARTWKIGRPLAFAADHRHVAVENGPEREVEVWDVVTRARTGRQPGGCPLAFWPDAGSLAFEEESIEYGDTLRLSAADTGLVRKELAMGKGSSIALSPDGRTAAHGLYQGNPRVQAPDDGTVELWDVPAGKVARRLRGLEYVAGLAFSADGKIVAAADAGGREGGISVKLWEMGTGKLLRTLKVREE